ncbi:MAG: site-specific integrase [Candidatus Pacebacteria bacterium]|nr:site-specific integrase [Candidatus Paceibacterota bacterium]
MNTQTAMLKAHATFSEPPPVLDASAWPAFWRDLKHVLRAWGFRPGTRRLYRAVLRGLARSSGRPPSQLEPRHLDAYLKRLAGQDCSASWIAMNISVLRTVFEKCCRRSLVGRRPAPRRPYILPLVLSQEETARLLREATSPRDALILSLLYGCGLKPGQIPALRWEHFDPDQCQLRLEGRAIPLPEGLLPIVRAGLERCGPAELVFPGRYPGAALSQRTIHRVVQTATRQAQLDRPVTPMTLRNSFAVHQLQAGHSVRQVQEWLGLDDIESVLRYCACNRIDDCRMKIDDLMQSAIGNPQWAIMVPIIPVQDSTPPFPVESPLQYFLAWFRNLTRWRPHRPSG